MNIRLLFPCLLVVCATLLLTGSVIAQSSEADPRQTSTTINANGGIRLETEPAAPTVEERRARTVTSATVARPGPVDTTLNLTNRFDQALLTAIQSHIGASYHFNRTGPEEFDCSGLVWRTFQDIGVNFQRGPARSYWATFEAPPKSEEFKFGTLVFFSNLSHVGIVVDEKGFYHSARHGGVMYSPFNDYWLSRIDGFRRVPPQSAQSTANAKPRAAKPASSDLIEEDREP
ncbi:MAG TPA: NlpC/P60 family protein [Pyrinomonadaceae bacterium]|nr:NlpC/P60 family protein [Pyrinomonadaceae bacterium]